MEYTHLELPSRRHVSLATWLAVVDRVGQPLLNATIALPATLPSDPAVTLAGARIIGGVCEQQLRDAEPLPDVTARLASLLAGGGCRTLVGHDLRNDLLGLGTTLTRLTKPYNVRWYDTAVSYGPFRGSGGVPRPLRVLAQRFLGTAIQQPGSPHDPVEDARAAMELYVRYAALEDDPEV